MKKIKTRYIWSSDHDIAYPNKEEVIEEYRDFLPEVALPGSCVVDGVELLDAVEFAALFPFEEVEVELAVVVGHCSLLCVAHAGNHGNGPDKPFVLHEEGLIVVHSQAYCNVDGSKPEVAAQAVENASQTRVLLGHAGQLAIGAVE